MSQNVQPTPAMGRCPAWCRMPHKPGETRRAHAAEFTFSGVVICWVQGEQNGELMNPFVRIVYPLTEGGQRTIEFRTTQQAADVGDLLSAIRVQELADVAACLVASYRQMGGSL